jgi:hypothetical protein
MYLAFIQLASIRVWLRVNGPRPSSEDEDKYATEVWWLFRDRFSGSA